MQVFRFLLSVVFGAAFCSMCFAEVRMEKLAKDKWLKIRSANFVIVTDAKEKLGRQMLQDLESFRYFVAETLRQKMLEGGPPLQVLAIESKRNFEYLDLPESWGGVFLKGLQGSYAVTNISNYSLSENTSDFGNHVLLHEYVHYFSRNLVESSIHPPWLDEGLAEYLATFRYSRRRSEVAIGSLDVAGFRLWDLRNRAGSRVREIELEELFKTTDILTSYRRGEKKNRDVREREEFVARFYARALVTYHYLQSTRQLQQQLVRYVALINAGISVDRAFERAFSTTFEAMDQAVRDYISGRAITGWTIDLEQAGVQFPDVSATVERVSEAEIYTELVPVLTRFSHYSADERGELLALAMAKGKRTPDLALAAFNHQRYHEQWSYKKTLQEVEAMVADFPGDPKILALHAEILLDHATMQRRVRHKDALDNLAIARNVARQAIKADGFNGPAYLALGRATVRARETAEKFLNEAAICLKSARLLVGEGYLSSILNDEMLLNVALQQPQALLQSLRKLAVVSDNEWIEEGYGHLLREALEMRTAALGAGEVSAGGLSYADGTRYRGSHKDGKPHGKGELESYLGGTMRGTWRQGVLEGKGEFDSAKGYRYTGDFADGYITGHGRVDHPAGSPLRYSEGQFLFGFEHGAHKFVYTDGVVTEGEAYLGAEEGEVQVKVPNAKARTVYFVGGNGLFTLDDGVLFSGRWGDAFRPEGEGVCWNRVTDRAWFCELGKASAVGGVSELGNTRGQSES